MMRFSRTCPAARSCSSGSRRIPATGIIRDRSRTDGQPSSAAGARHRQHRGGRASGCPACASRPSAAGFRARGWWSATRTTLRYFARADAAGARLVLSFRQPAHRRARVAERAFVDRHGAAARRRADGASMLRRRSRDRAARRCDLSPRGFPVDAGRRSAASLSHGWKPESGFLTGRWDHYCELMILYLLGIGSPTHALPPASWRAWSRPTMTFQQFTYVSGPDPLFVHQYSHAWIDFRGRRRAGTAADRLVSEFGRRDPRAQGVLSHAVERVSRLHRQHLGHHGLGQPQGICRLGRAATQRRHRRQRRAVGRGRLADVHAGASRCPRCARCGAGSARASTDATDSPTPFTRPMVG